MFRLAALAFLFASAFVALAAPFDAAKSVVRIQTASLDPDYKAPWNAGSLSGGVGAGFVIEGKRILTNAHVVSNAKFITVSREKDPRPYPAKVAHIAHDCDLALLQVDDPGFFKNTRPLTFGGIPAIESTVSAYGYPIGGDRLSVTRGVVSRVDFQTYSHSGVDSHLAIQISAPINPGNSGGPVVQDGKVVGVAFQGYGGDIAQNIGYMIPTPVIRRFLSDVEDGKYDRYVDLAVSYSALANPAARAALGITEPDRGVLVGSVFGGGSSEGKLQRGDVLMAIDGLPIASDGNVPYEGDTVPLVELVERKFRGDTVVLDILRDKKPMKVTIHLDDPWPFQLQANAYDEKPRYVVFGGLIFQPVDQNFMRIHEPMNLRLRYLFEHFISDHVYRERPELVALSGILPDSINSHAADFRYALVDAINGEKIRTLDDVAKAFAKPQDRYVIEMVGPGRPIVLEAEKVREAEDRIARRYGVPNPVNLEK